MEMQHTTAQVLRAHLLAEGVFDDPERGTHEFPIFISTLPPGTEYPVAAVATDTSGVLDGRAMKGSPLVHPGVSVRVRHTNFETGFRKAVAVATAFSRMRRTYVPMAGCDGYTVWGVRQTSAVLPMGVEPETRLFLFSVNFTVTIEAL